MRGGAASGRRTAATPTCPWTSCPGLLNPSTSILRPRCASLPCPALARLPWVMCGIASVNTCRDVGSRACMGHVVYCEVVCRAWSCLHAQATRQRYTAVASIVPQEIHGQRAPLPFQFMSYWL